MSRRGQQGDTGQTGTPGATGASGATGATGDPGQKGKTGDEGLRGPAGRSHPARVTGSFIAVVLIALAVVAGLAWFVILPLRETSRENATALKALCAQRDDLDTRILRTQRLLNRTKGRRMVFGIPRGLIVQGQETSRTTRRNLNILHC